jgi:PAS domain S-box-containing protein
MAPAISRYNRHILDAAKTCLLYYAFAQLGFLFALPGANITLLWLPSGIAMAAVVMMGNHAAWGTLAGAFLANYFPLNIENSTLTLQVAFAVATGNATGSLLAGAFFNRVFRRDDLRMEPSQVLLFLVIALLSTLPVAIWGTMQMTPNTTEFLLHEFTVRVMIWWAGDSAGILVGFPLLYYLYSKYTRDAESAAVIGQLAILSLGVVISVILYLTTYQQQQQSLQLRFQYVADVAFVSMENAVEQIFQHQASMVDKVSRAFPPTRTEFEEIVQIELFGPYRVDGIFSISWNPIVLDADRSALEAQARAQGYDNFVIRERDAAGQLQISPTRELYVVVLHIEPLASNLQALGYDIYSDASRRATVDQVLQLGQPVLTPPINLVQIAGQDTTPGALLLSPVRAQSMSPEPAIAGFVVMVISYDQMFTQISGDLTSDAYLSVYDVTNPAAISRIFANSSDNPELALQDMDIANTPFLSDSLLEVGQRKLQVIVQPRPEFYDRYQDASPLVVLLVALSVSFLTTLLYIQRRRIDEARADMYSRTSQIVSGTPDAMVAINEDGLVTEWNQAAVDLFGYSNSEAMGKNLGHLIIPPAMRQAHWQAMINRVPEAESKIINHTVEVTACRASGEEFPAELAVKSVSVKGGQEFVGLIRDLTERKALEEKQRQQQKLELIGQMTGGLAHDFNNLMGIVIANLDYLELDKLGEQNEQHARSALDAALRAAQVTRSLMSVARKQEMEIQTCDLNALIRELYPLMEATVGKHVDLRVRLSHQPLWAPVDRTGFNNAVINLLINARDAIKGSERKEIVLSTRVEELRESFKELLPGIYVVVEVQDTGTGIPDHVREHVFEPFFTTKEIGDGTGLGLSMVYGFARQLNGTIDLESSMGIGTEVSIYLPLIEGSQPEPEPEPEPETEELSAVEEAQQKTILLVDDEHSLRRIAVRIFSDLGFRVLQADSADSALEILAGEHIDILFSDIAMPGRMNGTALAEWVAEHQPQVRIILVTGYLDEQSLQAVKPEWQILEKPYRRDDVKRVLDAG